MYEHMVINRQTAHYQVFRNILIEQLLGVYDFCLQVKNDNTYIEKAIQAMKQKTIMETLGSAWDSISNLVTTPLHAVGGAPSQETASQALSGLGKAGLVIYFIWTGVKQKRLLNEAKSFLNQTGGNRDQFEKNLSELTDRLYFRYHLGIQKLHVAIGDPEGVPVLVGFFAYAISKNLKNSHAKKSDENLVDYFLRISVLEKSDEVYKNTFTKIKLKRVTSLNRDDNNNVKSQSEWTLEGFILRSPAQVYGESIEVKNINVHSFEKYEAVLFRDRIEAVGSSYSIESGPGYLVRDLTDSCKYGFSFLETSTKVLNSVFWSLPCSEPSVQEEELRLLVVEGDKKLNAIKAKLSNSVNMNGRGLPSTLCSYWKKLYDKTPLMIAAVHGQVKTAGLLIEHGANFNLLDYEGNTALDLTIQIAHASDDNEFKENLRNIIGLLSNLYAFQNKTTKDDLDSSMSITTAPGPA